MNFETERHFKNGRELFSKGRYGEAVQEFKRAIKLSPNFPDLYNQLGLAYHLNGEFEEAIKSFKLAIKLNPKYVEAHLNLSITLNELGRYEEAVSNFSMASDAEDLKEGMAQSIRNQLAEGHTKLGDTYYEIAYFQEAAEEYVKALKVHPRFHDIRLKLAKTYMNLDQFDHAVRELETILALNSNYIEALVLLGVAYLKSGRKSEARKHWQQCLEKDPQNIRVKTYLALMEKS